MGDAENALSGGTPRLPSWLAKTHSRYEEDNIAFSPPNEDGSTFFSLHFGQSEETHADTQSTFDRINEELGFVEVSSDRRLSLSLNRGLTSRNSGLCLNTELQQSVSEERIENCARDDRATAVKPLLVISNPFAASKQDDQPAPDSTSPPLSADANNELQLSSKLAPFIHNVTTEDESVKSTEDKDQVKKELNEHLEGRQLGILGRVKNLVIQSFKSSEEPTSGSTSAPVAVPTRKTSAPSQITSELTRGAGLEQQSNKEFTSTGGVMVERKMQAYNSFFYRPEGLTMAEGAGGSGGGQVALAGGSAESSPSQPSAAGRAMTAAQANEMAVAAAAAATLPGKARRPKPSRLREMNFWAPTSM